MSDKCECDDDMTSDGHGSGCEYGVTFQRARAEAAEAEVARLRAAEAGCDCASCKYDAAVEAQRVASAPLSERERALVAAARAMLLELKVRSLDHDLCEPGVIKARWQLEQSATAALAPYAEVE